MFKNVGQKIQILSAILFIVLSLSAFIGAIILWSELKYIDGCFWIGFGTLVGGVVSVFIVSLLVQGFAIIVTDHEKSLTKEDGKSSDYMSVVNGTSGVNEWKCPKCGKINQNYVGTCGCGQIKP